MAKSIDIKPLDNGEFLITSDIIGPCGWNCVDADSVGENMEAAIWPLIAPALKERKHITINVVIDGKIA